ncbi:prepilin peptidase [Cellulomonas endophytica]|uniref:prepilin peptidase n=1 Tax=Cellulomonas endophytica TaxID=2494735 RepID=UPI001010D1C4|nr:A24 family peptidase [Cellulomonas endophytica]
MTTGPLVAFCAVLGLAVGSFLNVVVWRVPRGESVAHPPSACPACGHAVRPRDNVPVLSWLLLRGRCRDCGVRISRRYPLVEAGTAVLVALVPLVVTPWAVPAYAYLVAIGVALALIDLDTQRLPNAIVLPAYPVLAVLLTLASAGTGDWAALGRAAVGGAALFAGYFVLRFAQPGGMGFGDVKLAGPLGAALAWLGWGPFAVGAFAAFLLGGVFGLGLMATRRAGRRTGIPFGPWMLVGAALGALVGEPAWDAYVSLLA